jgi:acetyltransferase-like isoleucine patch superfamily enzyme
VALDLAACGHRSFPIREHVPAMTSFIHPTAVVEADVELGEGTSVWDHVHIRRSARLGQQCIVGGKSYIAYDVSIGNRVKINSLAYICNAVTIEDGVMISAGVIFTNDRFPRAATNDLQQLRSSTPDEHTLPTRVREGATIGAGAIIGNDLVIGRFAMIGMGSIVTRSVADFHLVIGNPARSIGCVCRCGEPLLRWAQTDASEPVQVTCAVCSGSFEIRGQVVSERAAAPELHPIVRCFSAEPAEDKNVA